MYGDVWVAALESNARLRHLVGDIYLQHGVPRDDYLADAPHRSALQTPALSWAHTLLSTRYLVLELWSFQDMRDRHYRRTMDGLGVEDRDGLHVIIAGYEHARESLKGMRNDFVAHMNVGLDEFAKAVNSVGLAPIVHYARAAIMFQDAVYRAIPHEDRPKSATHKNASRQVEIPSCTDRQALEKKYSQLGFALDTERFRHECGIMRDLQTSLCRLYAMFCEAAAQKGDSTLDSTVRFRDQMYNMKYMILDIHNFIVELDKLGIDVPEPGFLRRREEYVAIRNDYVGHTRVGKMPSMEGLLLGRPSLPSNVLADIVEIDVLASRLLEGLPDSLIGEITPMTAAQISEIDAAMRETQRKSLEHYDYRYADPHEEEKRREARERAKRDMGLR